MMLVDAIVRFGGVALLLAIAIARWNHDESRKSAPYLILSCISVAALLIGYSPIELRAPAPIHLLARFADIPHLVFVWLFALSLYDQNFSLKRTHLAVGILHSAPIFWIRLAEDVYKVPQPGWLLVFGAITSIALIAHLIWATLGGRGDDLIEQRRSSRSQFVILLFFTTMLAAASELVPPEAPIDRTTAKAIAIFPAIAFGAVWMLRFKPPLFEAELTREREAELRPRDQALLEKLEAYLIEDEGYRDPALTIVKLSAAVGVNQHRLRALVNQSLGYTNFSAFINGVRIGAVCAAMEAPDGQELSLLTLAMDAGFTSLSTFNKAFKSLHGMTPSQYRAELRRSPTKPRNSSAFLTNPQDAERA